MKPVTKKKERYIMLNYSLIVHFATYMKKMVTEIFIREIFVYFQMVNIVIQ